MKTGRNNLDVKYRSRKVISILICIIVCISMIPLSASAGSFEPVKVKNTTAGNTYEVIKRGNSAYVAGRASIYLVNTKTGKVQEKPILNKIYLSARVTQMAVYNGYIYYAAEWDDDGFGGAEIGRISLKTGKLKLLKDLNDKSGLKIKVKNKKIYYRYSGMSSNRYCRMSLTGKNKVTKKGKITFPHKKTTSKGYLYGAGSEEVYEYDEYEEVWTGYSEITEYLKKADGKKVIIDNYLLYTEGA